MADINYLTVVDWDSSLRDVGFADADDPTLAGLAISAIKMTTGTPASHPGHWLPSAEVFNEVDKTLSIMTGTTASPAWTTFTALVPASNTITTAMIQNAAITLAKLAAGITPSHVAKFGGKITWSGSGATLATTVAGVLSTDIVEATIQGAPTQAAYLKSAAPTTDTVTLVLSAANTSNDAVIAYTVFRAAA